MAVKWKSMSTGTTHGDRNVRTLLERIDRGERPGLDYIMSDKVLAIFVTHEYDSETYWNMYEKVE